MELGNKAAINSNNLDIKTNDSFNKIKNLNDVTSNFNNSEKGKVVKEEGVSYDEKIDKVISEINEKFKIANRTFSYELHDKTNRFVVKVKDLSTGDVIREIPTEESLDLFAKMLEMVGLLVDEKS